MNFENYEQPHDMYISENDVEFETTKSSGPGGQNVNKRSTTVRLRASIDTLPLSEEIKAVVKENLSPRHSTKDGEIIVENAEGRSQSQNRQNALRIANEEIEKAIRKGKEKHDTKKHKERARKRQQKGGGGAKENIKEKQKRQYRSETTDDLLEQAYEEDPDLKDRLSND